MWAPMVILVPVLLPTLVIKSTSCSNETDHVFVKYSGHAEANYPYPPQTRPDMEIKSPTQMTTRLIITTAPSNPSTIFHRLTTTKATTLPEYLEDETEGVVFIPNDAPVVRLEDEEDRHGLKLQDVMSRKGMSDVLDKQYRLETEAPNDIVFIAEKINDFAEHKSKEAKQKSGRRSENNRRDSEEKYTTPKLDCTNLICNNTIKSICGRKMIERKVHHRLFLNECYFKKVNCNFKYEISRYTETSLDRCQKIGAHLDERPFSFKSKLQYTPKEREEVGARRSFSSRRSMAMNMNGQFCSHACPVSCPDDYDPECAVSSTGQKRVFMNHCKMDDNSCLYAVVWHKRPLSECVGGKKADMRQNRFFIGWMQRVGLLDKKGKLVLE